MQFILCDFCVLCVESSFLSVKSVKSVVQFFWLRLAAPSFLRIFAAVSLYSILRTPLYAVYSLRFLRSFAANPCLVAACRAGEP
jgi:hypothetical protein